MLGVIRPNKSTELNINGRKLYKICINIKHNPITGVYTWDEVFLKIGQDLNYDNIVNAIINFKYPSDKMQSVINNYLLEPKNKLIIIEFNEMQNWRKYSKEYAKEILQEYK